MTEKEKVLLQRMVHKNALVRVGYDDAAAKEDAKSVYPLPKKLREGKMGGKWSYRYDPITKNFECYTDGGYWIPLLYIYLNDYSADELSLLADLRRNPYVEVDDD